MVVIYQVDPLKLILEMRLIRFAKLLAQFGLGVRTGIDLPNESDRI